MIQDAQDWPWVGITMGDPTGIGPEIVVGALFEGLVHRECHPLAIGRSELFRRAAQLRGWDLDVVPVLSVEEAKAFCISHPECVSRTVLCLETGSPELDALIGLEQKDAPGVGVTVDARAGQAAYECVARGARMCLAKELDALVTAPLHKVALHGAGHDWPGHTELLAHLCGVPASAMMLYLPPGKPNHGGEAGLGVVHVTLHCALREVFALLTQERIEQSIAMAHGFFTELRRGMGLDPNPAIAVAALNPHGGESGRFGDEESRVIGPAVEKSRRQGMNVVGPLPVDTLMPAAAGGKYDAVVAMYHDQGHIALKLLDMFEAVNITLGLNIVRTSVAHGTAHDIAWKGKAECGGMTQAILVAARLARSGKRVGHAVHLG